MNKQILTMLAFVMVFISFASADRALNNEELNLPVNIYGGSEFIANFSFDYLGTGDNINDSPLIIQLNITSENTSYPVNKGDFNASGTLKKCGFWFLGYCVWESEVAFSCDENYSQMIENPLDAQEVFAPNGTFYCYNSEGNLDINERDNAILEIKPNLAIYPGKYNITAKAFYLTDARNPFINITNKKSFNRYYRELDNIEVTADITDGSKITEKWGTIFADEEITVPFSHKNDSYHFTKVLPIDIPEGDYLLSIFAVDEFNNTGRDNVTLKIDRTAPLIEVISPTNDSVVSKIIIEVNSTDLKAGLNESSVKYRLREMNGSNICPETGSGSWDCYNSGWVTLPKVGEVYKTELNSSSEISGGEYWLEISSCDILGNCGEL